MDIGHTVLAVALAVQFYNLGTIWFAQLVVYPLFGKVTEEGYIAYHRSYSSWIPLPIIMPGFLSFLMPMAVFAFLPASVPVWLAVANVAMGFVGLAVTVGLEIPRHSKLEKDGKDEKLIRELIGLNWPRTASITISAVLTAAMANNAFLPA